MPPRTRKKNAPRRRRFRGIRPFNLATEVFQADAVVTAFMGQGIGPALIAPFMPGRTYKQGIDGALDLKEVWQGITGTGLFEPGAGAGGAWVGDWAGAPSVDSVGLGGVIMKNLQKGAVPAAIKIVGSNVVAKIAKRTLGRPLNKITKQIGFSDMVRW